MSLSPGTRLGAYEVIAPIGAGGMGEVYRARDTRLDRIVAIKVLPSSLTSNADLRDRFEREARAISSLQHPNVCALFDVGEVSETTAPPDAESIRFLVLEYLEGETLAARLARAGAIPLNEALRIAIDLAGALDAAHRANIVHRDLKPANVFLVRSGPGSAPPTVKLLDFGLAKPATPVIAASGQSMLPTTPPTLTAQGTILGTFQYMAPEQIEGIDADARTDIFAFGLLLFEMLTARPAFEGRTRATLLGAILKDTPPSVSALQPAVPKAVDHVITTCVAKDPNDRWQSARDLGHELQWIASGGADSVPGGTVAVGEARSTWRTWAAIVATALASTAIGAGLALAFRRPAAPASIQFSIPQPTDATFATPLGGGTGVATQTAISPDGRYIVFVATRQLLSQLWLRPIAAGEPTVILGTEGAAFPFWSPDSRNIGFFAAGKLKRVSVGGGPPITLCDASGGRGGTWNRDNVILFTPNTSGGLQRVSAAGGTPVDASQLDASYEESSHRFPWFLPDGRHFLFAASVGTCCPPRKEGRVRVGALDTMEATVLMPGDSAAVYGGGHVLFQRDNTLMAQPFDPAARTFSGEPFPIAENVANEGSRYASVSVSESGALVYARDNGQVNTRLIWFDRSGKEVARVGDLDAYGAVALSANERRLVVPLTIRTPPSRNLWLLDGATGAPTRLTFDAGASFSPIWSPDDQRIAYIGSRAGATRMLQKLASGLGNEETVLETRTNASPTDWTADGKIIYTLSQATGGSTDIYVLPLTTDRKPVAYLTTPNMEGEAVLSPNGKWMAYQSTESGQTEIFVQSFPIGGGKFQISQSGGLKAMWRRDGKELFFLSLDGNLMAVDFDQSDISARGIPKVLFRVATMAVGGSGRQYAVSRDGQRILVSVLEQESAKLPITVVINWLASLQR